MRALLPRGNLQRRQGKNLNALDHGDSSAASEETPTPPTLQPPPPSKFHRRIFCRSIISYCFCFTVLAVAVCLFLEQLLSVKQGLAFSRLKNRADSQNHACAPWIKNRKVLFLGIDGWPYNGNTGGENYLGACLDFALRQNGFHVEKMHHKYFTADGDLRVGAKKLKSFYRIVLGGPKWHSRFNEREIGCKVRALNWWGNWKGGDSELPLDPKQMLTPFPDDYNSFVGFFPHSSLLRDPPVPQAERGRTGLILGKSPEYFTQYQDLIEALVASNFTIHVTCRDRKNEPCQIPEGVIRHRYVDPREFEELLPRFAFMLGLKNPIISPSPLLGLTKGVAFLNPYLSDDAVDPMPQTLPLRHSAMRTQHNAIASLGMPYVYNVNLKNVSDVLSAAERAVRYRFVSFTPWEFRPEAMISRVCGMMEDDALCQCPNPVFGNEDSRLGPDENMDPDLDCHGSLYVRNVGK